MTTGVSPTGRREDTIADYMKILARDWELEDWFVWPPDTFAFTSLLLKKTGIYTLVIDLPDGKKWPDNSDKILPTEHCDCKETKISYDQAFETIQFEWFEWIESDKKPMPSILLNIKKSMEKLYTIVTIDELYSLTEQNGFGSGTFNKNAWRYCQLLLSLHMLADQACAGMGTPSANRLTEDATKIAHGIANMFLTLHGSLSRLPILTVRVLPKMRTSRSGITLRSLSHHVTAHRTEVDIQWRTMPWVNIDDNTLNILIIPWPYHIKPSSFSPSNYTVNRDTKERTRYFQYQGEREQFNPAALISMIQNSQKNVARIHLIVFPEAALDEKNFDSLLWALQTCDDLDRTQLPMVLAGIHESTLERSTKLGRNQVILATFFAGKWYKMHQDKHHRWKLNPPQITRYGLSGVLSGENDWWEAIHIPKRRLSVLAPNNWLTLCPLICEDLARLEPVSELIRGIGPTLLIALLMDGPQLKSRWPSRYATVMADDPGTSVLSVSSLGLVRVSPDKEGKTGSQVIALWNDQESGLKEISVDDPESGGVILTISAEWHEEITADGRSDNHNAAVFTFQNIYQVRSREQNHNIELNLNKNFKQSDKNDLQEISIFSSFIDTIFDLNDMYCYQIKSWIIDDIREFDTKSMIGNMYKDLFDIFKEKYKAMNHYNTTSDHEDLNPYINWIFNMIIEIKEKYKLNKENIYEIFVDIISDILNKVEGYKFVNDVFHNKNIYVSHNNINIDIMGLFGKERDEIPNHRKIRIIIYDCLAILWTIHTRLNYLRKHGNFHQKHAELSHQIEQLWAEKYDEKWLLARQREKK